jgi:hypothetical protein
MRDTALMPNIATRDMHANLEETGAYTQEEVKRFSTSYVSCDHNPLLF